MFGVYLNMKILNQINSPTFKSRPICPLNLKKTTGIGDFLSVVFSKLDPGDAEDVLAIKRIQNTWKDFSTITCICPSFLKMAEIFKDKSSFVYHCIEIPRAKSTLLKRAEISFDDEQDLSQRAVSLITSGFDPETRKFTLYYVATKDEYQFENEWRPLKNIGEVAMGAVINEAKKAGASSFCFKAAQDGFYEKIFERAGILFDKNNHDFTVAQAQFDKYIKYIQQKFCIDFSKQLSLEA